MSNLFLWLPVNPHGKQEGGDECCRSGEESDEADARHNSRRSAVHVPLPSELAQAGEHRHVIRVKVEVILNETCGRQGEIGGQGRRSLEAGWGWEAIR